MSLLKNKVGIIVPPNPNPNNSYEKGKLHGLIPELEKEGLFVQEFYYSDDIVAIIENNLLKVDMVLVWINPNENGKNRSVLDAMLKRVAKKGIHVSTHPDIILKMGTKEVLFTTRALEWGSDIDVYKTPEDMKKSLVTKLQTTVSRVLKQNRGNGGNGVWRIEFASVNLQSKENPYVKVLHAVRNSIEEQMLLFDFINNIQNYFKNNGIIIDQEFISPEPNGMIRCYLSRNKVVGFGHQFVKNLLRSVNPGEVMESSPRIYYPKDEFHYQDLRGIMENSWIKQMTTTLGIKNKDLPILWDVDFLYRTKSNKTSNKYVLCEINVSSVYPFPESAIPDIVQNIKQLLNEN